MHAIALTVLLLAGTAASPPERPGDEWQYLTRHLNFDGFEEEALEGRSGGFDTAGTAFQAGSLPAGDKLEVRSERWGTVKFPKPPTEGDSPNFISCQGQEIPIRTGKVFNALFSLGTCHHGPRFGWVEFRFEDGSTGRGPIGFSDWYYDPIIGDERAFAVPVLGWLDNPPAGGCNLCIQVTPIPARKRVVSIRLPVVPQIKIMGLTLGWRDGVRPIVPPEKTKPEPGLVGIFAEPCFPYFAVRGDLDPVAIRDAFVEAGIPAALLDIEQLRAPDLFNAEAYPLLVNPYGNAFPLEALGNLRQYRLEGGSMVHLAVPFTHPVERTPYGGFVDRDHTESYLRHEGPVALGCGAFVEIPQEKLSAGETLASWGLGDVMWNEFVSTTGRPFGPAQVLSRESLAPEDEVVPLLTVDGHDEDPFAALVRHRACPFDGAVDLWLGHICPWSQQPLEGPVALTVECIARGGAAILKDKGLISDATWRSICKPVAESLQKPAETAPVPPDPQWSWHLPVAPRARRRVLWADVRPLLNTEKVLLSSAQGLVNRSEAEVSVYLVDGPAAERTFEWYASEGLIDKPERVEPRRILEAAGRPAVVVDPDLRGSLNFAIAVAAAEGLLVAYPRCVETYDLEVAADLRGLFKSQAEGYAWAIENIRPGLSARAVAMVQPETRRHAIVDYLIACRILPFWVSWAGESAIPGAALERERSLACRFLAEAPVGTAVLVTPRGAGGSRGLEMASMYGKHLVDVEGIANLSFTSGVRATDGTPALRPQREEAAGPGGKRKFAVPVVADLARLPGVVMSFEIPEEALRAGFLLPPATLDLLPAPATHLRSRLEGAASGSRGLGRIDAGAFGTGFGRMRGEAVALYWKLVDQSMQDLRQRFLVLEGWSEPAGPEVSACVRGVPSAELILAAPSQDVDIVETAYLVDGRPVLHALPEGEDLDIPDGAAFFTWYTATLPDGPFALPGVETLDPLQAAVLGRELLEEAALTRVSIVAAGATWKYHDRGQDLGKDWSGLDYDDSEWSSGAAELGYGDTKDGHPESTQISFGPAERAKHPSTYFRHAFEVDDPALFSTFLLEVVRDDGCLAYLNGREVARSNMPEGDVAYGTLASETVGGDDERKWHGFRVKPMLFRKGKNVLAVEVHQSVLTSSDLSFDLRLTGRRKEPETEEDSQTKDA